MLPISSSKRPFHSTYPAEMPDCKRRKISDYSLHDLALAAILKRVLFGPHLDKKDFDCILPEQNNCLSSALIRFPIEQGWDKPSLLKIAEFICKTPALCQSFDEIKFPYIKPHEHLSFHKELFRNLGAFTNLRKVDLSEFPITDREMDDVKWESLSQLEELNCERCCHLTNASIVALRRMPQLTALNLQSTAVTPDIFQFDLFTNLQSLSINFSKINCQNATYSTTLTSLTYLDIPKANDSKILSLFPPLTALKRFRVSSIDPQELSEVVRGGWTNLNEI